MIVKQMLEAIEKKELKIIEIAKKYQVSDRTVQTKIKKLGFKWNAKEAKYIFEGSNKDVMNIQMDDLFNNKKNVNDEIKKRPEKTIENASKKNIIKDSTKTLEENDIISSILSGGRKEKSYRGFYLDDDVLSVLDKVHGGKKSELVNECLREAFKKRGVL